MGNSQGSYELSTTKAKEGVDTDSEDGPLGLESCAIPASRITASSSTDAAPAFFARLNGTKSWCAGSPADCFLEVDLDTVHYVTAVATQGNPSGNHDYVKMYKIQYSTDGLEWEFYKENYKQVVQGNTDSVTAVKRKLDPKIKARYVRFWPTAWFQWPCLRVEIYGSRAPPEMMAENGTTAITFEVKDTQPAEEREQKQEVKNEEKQSLDEDEIKEKIEDQEKPQMEENEQEERMKQEQEVKDFEQVDIEIKGSNDEGQFEQEKLANDVETEVMEKIFESLETSTPAKPNGVVNKQKGINEEREVSKSVGDEGSLKRLMEVKTKLEFEAEARKLREEQRVEMRRKKNKKVTLGYETPDYFYVPRRVYNDMWGDSPSGSLSDGLDNESKEEKPLIEQLDGGAPLAKLDDDMIEEATDQTRTVTIKTITTRIHHEHGREHHEHGREHPEHGRKHPEHGQENHEHGREHPKHGREHHEHGLEHPEHGREHPEHGREHHEHGREHHDVQYTHTHDSQDGSILTPSSADFSQSEPEFFTPSSAEKSKSEPDILLLNGFGNRPVPFAARASCEHLHPLDPVVQVAMESSFSERVDSLDQINLDPVTNRRFSGLDLLQSPYDAVSGDDIERLLAWEDDTLPGWTRIKKTRDYEMWKGTAVDGGPPIIKTVITLKKIAYDEAVRRITDWETRKAWDKTFDNITFIEQSYNFNVLHCSMKKQGLTLAVLDDVDIDEPYHASVWSVADHPDSSLLSKGKPLRYETMISGLVIRPTPDGYPSSRVTLLCQVKGRVSPPLRNSFLVGNPDKWLDALKKYTPGKTEK